MIFLGALLVQIAVGLDGDECTHFTYFKDINHGICDRAIIWAEWIYFPNMFGDRTYEDFGNRITQAQEGGLSEHQVRQFCYFIFPSCKVNPRKIKRPETPQYLPGYHKQASNWCDVPNNKRRDNLSAMGLTINEQSVLLNHCAKKEAPLKKNRNALWKYAHCDDNFKISHKDFETQENMFLVYAYCINQRAVEASYDSENEVYMRIYKIGQSAQRRDIIAVELWIQEDEDSYKLMPESRLMGNIHGNEDQGVFILMPLINEYSIATAELRPEIYQLLSKVRVHVLVSLNPDGYLASREAANQNNGRVCWLCGRNNQNNIDLNRNFPYLYQTVSDSIELRKHGRGNTTHVEVPASYYRNGTPQPETIAIIRWSENHNFVVSAMVHSGAWVYNYPYDTSKEHPFASKANPSDDEPAFLRIGRNFTTTHGIMKTRQCQMDKDAGFVDGMTNGAAWYSLQGTLQDYGYIGRGIMEVTLEMGCEKTVRESQTNSLYMQNRDAFRFFLWQTYTGIFGTISDRVTFQPIEGVEVFVSACSSTDRYPHCDQHSDDFSLNRLSAITSDYGRFFKVYYPEAVHNVICITTRHPLYDDHEACDWKENFEFDRPEVNAKRISPYNIRLTKSKTLADWN